MEGVDLHDQSFEGMAGAGPQLVLAHQILIAQRYQFALALMKRKGTEGVDLHDHSLEGTAGAGPALARQGQNLAHRHRLAMGMEGADLHEEQELPLVAMEGAGAVMGMEGVDSQGQKKCSCRLGSR